MIGKSEEATLREQKKIRRKSQQGGPEVRPETLEYAAWMMVFTTLPREQFGGAKCWSGTGCAGKWNWFSSG